MIDIEINSSNIFLFFETLQSYFPLKKYVNLLEQDIEGHLQEISKLIEVIEY